MMRDQPWVSDNDVIVNHIGYIYTNLSALNLAPIPISPKYLTFSWVFFFDLFHILHTSYRFPGIKNIKII